jgi:hypothetical protein
MLRVRRPPVPDYETRIKRLYSLAETLGRLSGEAHNLASDLAARMAAQRASIRSLGPTKQRRAPREKKA